MKFDDAEACQAVEGIGQHAKLLYSTFHPLAILRRFLMLNPLMRRFISPEWQEFLGVQERTYKKDVRKIWKRTSRWSMVQADPSLKEHHPVFQTLIVKKDIRVLSI